MSEYHHLLILTKIWHGYWYNQLESMNMRVDEDHWRSMGMGRVSIRKVQRFSSNKFWNNIGCLVLSPTFGLVWLILWEKY